jgi:hypothetical protein
MSDVGFHETRDGRQFYCVTMPELVRQLTRLNDLLALAIEIADKKKDANDVRPRED